VESTGVFTTKEKVQPGKDHLLHHRYARACL
jgi:hypothetical protein